MKTNKFMQDVIFILFLVLIWRETNTVTSLGHQLVSTNCVRNNKCINKEIQALLEFKASVKDSNGQLSSWRAEKEDCCKWNGVTCNDQTGHVTKLHLGNSDLGGKINPSLHNLSYLSHLNLSNNSFHGTIPRSIGSLTALRFLDLSQNFLNGTIPPEFGNLTSLQLLSLGSIGSCTIENLDWLTRLSHLYYLDMDGISLAKQNHWVNVILSLQKLSFLSFSDCDLSHVVYPYSFVANSSSIATLSLRDNNLNSSMYYWLFPLTSNKLLDLDLSGNTLDVIPKYLGNLCSLTSLDISVNSAVVKFLGVLKNLSGCTCVILQELYASRSQYTGSLPDEFQKFTSLKTLTLDHNLLSGTISEKVWELPKLGYLDVSSNSLTGFISENIGKSKLWYINLSENSLEGHLSKAYMSNISYLRMLDVTSSKLGPRFPKWIQKLKNLTNLAIPSTGISDKIPVEFWSTWPSQLKCLNLSFNNVSGIVIDLSSNFDLQSVIDLSSNSFYGPITNVSSTLASLNLSRNKFYGEISFICQMVDGFLSYLDLSHNSFTGKLPDCLWHFKELKVLNLGHNNLSGRLPNSVASLEKLEVLYLYNNYFCGELPVFKELHQFKLFEFGGQQVFW